MQAKCIATCKSESWKYLNLYTCTKSIVYGEGINLLYSTFTKNTYNNGHYHNSDY